MVPEEMPLDQATVRWSEQREPARPCGDPDPSRQDVADPGQAAYGENLAFNPWHALPVHAPQGSISEARRVVYAASADLRRNANGIPLAEPSEPRPDPVIKPVVDTCIVKAAIHPAIGIARVGNSEEEFFLGPEVPEPSPGEAGSFATGKASSSGRRPASVCSASTLPVRQSPS